MVLGIDCKTKSQNKETDATLFKGHLAKIHLFRWVLRRLTPNRPTSTLHAVYILLALLRDNFLNISQSL